jgi:hypothetical protein
MKSVRLLAVIALLYGTLCVAQSYAGDLETATNALNDFLSIRGGGAVARQDKCPKDGNAEYVLEYKAIPLNDGATAVSMYTLSCPEGNGTDQHISIIKGGKGAIILDSTVGVSQFMGDDMTFDGENLIITGHKWEDNDAHCCPSREGKLIYNVQGGWHKFQLHKVKTP